jgi:arginine/ornithine N-succinyltransferase beta subunit
MDQVALDRLAARASAAGFSSIAEYAESLEHRIRAAETSLMRAKHHPMDIELLVAEYFNWLDRRVA